jgi:hypothetical protein
MKMLNCMLILKSVDTGQLVVHQSAYRGLTFLDFTLSFRIKRPNNEFSFIHFMHDFRDDM